MTVVFQIDRIQAIDNELPVKIDIDTKSRKIQIEGQAESITSALDLILSIFFEIEKEERSKLEAESILKEVITCTTYLVSLIFYPLFIITLQ